MMQHRYVSHVLTRFLRFSSFGGRFTTGAGFGATCTRTYTHRDVVVEERVTHSQSAKGYEGKSCLFCCCLCPVVVYALLLSCPVVVYALPVL